MTLTGQRHRIDDPPDAAALVLEGTKLAVYRWEARILIDLDHERARRVFPPAYGVVVEPAPHGQTLLRVASDDLASLATYAAGLSYDFEVLDPPELRAELHRRAQAIADRHADRSADRSAGRSSASRRRQSATLPPRG